MFYINYAFREFCKLVCFVGPLINIELSIISITVKANTMFPDDRVTCKPSNVTVLVLSLEVRHTALVIVCVCVCVTGLNWCLTDTGSFMRSVVQVSHKHLSAFIVPFPSLPNTEAHGGERLICGRV